MVWMGVDSGGLSERRPEPGVGCPKGREAMIISLIDRQRRLPMGIREEMLNRVRGGWGGSLHGFGGRVGGSR